MVRFLANVLWVIFGGFYMAMGWAITGVILAISIVGLPWARAAFLLARFTLWPFGHAMVDRAVLTGQEDLGTGVLGDIGNVVWFVIAGWWLAIGHLGTALGLAVTIIGIPFAIQHVKMAGAALFPIGKAVVSREEAVRRGLVG